MTSIHVRRLESRVARTAARLVDHAEREGLDVGALAATRLPWYLVRNAADDPTEPATVFIFDEIGGSLGVSAKDFAAELEAITAPEIRVRINSPGGALFDGIAIHNALRHHPARVIAYVDALAASAASVVAMGADEIVMMPGSQMMIHDASAVQDGSAADMAKMSTFLDRQSDNVADLYQRRGGGDVAEWRALMLAETWMFAQEAVDMGLADRVEEIDADELADGRATNDELMTRRFDLSQFRYAGRCAAPAPTRRATSPPRPAGRARGVDREHLQLRGRPVQPRLSTDADQRAAARRRAAAAGERATGRVMSRRTAPVGISNGRQAAFPASLRAELVDRNGQQRYHLRGHASVVGVPYEMWDEFGPYMEVIEAGAFDTTLAADPDVAFLVNHRGVTMARTTNGSLVLGTDDVGLPVDAWLNPKRQDVSDLVVAVQDRDVTEMSFAFMLVDGGGRWSDDFTTFRISEVDINRGDVSAVNYGANPYTDVAARARGVLADLERLPAGAARAAVAMLQSRSDVADLEAAFLRLDHAERVDSGRLGDVPELVGVRVGRTISNIEALLLDD